jgi:hypothetical protein
MSRLKQLLCRHLWEHRKEVDWYGNNLIECQWKKCRKCGKAVYGKWMQIGGCK